MKTLKFKILGNQQDPKGNPIPCPRTTQNTQWTPKAVRYQEWMMYVVAGFIDAVQAIPKENRNELAGYINFAGRKPIVESKRKVRMDIMIDWHSDGHGDCDNIFKGIADALFTNDKYVVGTFDYRYPEDKQGAVEVLITFL